MISDASGKIGQMVREVGWGGYSMTNWHCGEKDREKRPHWEGGCLGLLGHPVQESERHGVR